MESRKKDLKDIKDFIDKVDMEMTMALQQLQWDRNKLLEKPSMVNCKFISNHRIPLDRQKEHESQCFLRSNGYSKEEIMLPDPIDSNSSTLIKLNKKDIQAIINKAAQADPSFKRGKPQHEKLQIFICLINLQFYITGDNAVLTLGSKGVEPMSLARLHTTYTTDERRAIHDAVVEASPSCHDLSDLALLSGNGEDEKNTKQKSRLDILAELRDMKRRRTKYRVAAKTRNYSDLLRDVIKTQMEVYTEVKEDQLKGKQNDQTEGNKATELQNRTENYRTGNIDRRHNELSRTRNRDRPRSRDNRTFQHYQHDFQESGKKRERTDRHHQNYQSSSRYDHREEEAEENYRKRKKSAERSDKNYRADRNFNNENYDYRDKRIKKEKIDESEDTSSVEYTTDRQSRNDYHKTSSRHYDTEKYRQDKDRTKNKYNVEQVYIKQEDDRYDTGNTSKIINYDESRHSKESSKRRHADEGYERNKVKKNKFNVEQVYIKQEDDRYDTGKTGKIINYDGSRHSKESSKLRHADEGYERNKDKRKDEKHKYERPSNHRSSDTEVRKRNEESQSQYRRRYYD